MARIAKKPVSIPKGVDVKIDRQQVTIKGPKGQMTYLIPEPFSVVSKDQALMVVLKEEGGATEDSMDKRQIETTWGTIRAKLNNIVEGVVKEFERKLLLVGVGYRAQMQGKQLSLSLGFSHPVGCDVPAGVTVQLPSQTEIIIRGIDREVVGQFAANIRAIRSVEPYKGKGVRYSDEVVILKETKKK